MKRISLKNAINQGIIFMLNNNMHEESRCTSVKGRIKFLNFVKYKLDKEKIDEELSEEFYNNMIGELEFEYTNLNTYANSDWILDNFCISDLDNFKFGKVDQGARIKICDLLNRNWEIGDLIPKIKIKVIMYFLLPDEDTDYYFELEDATIEEI